MEIYNFFTVVIAVVVLYSSGQATAQDPACVEKLIPCQPFIGKENPQPTSTCCLPLKDIIEKNAPCLCAVFNDPAILKTFNVSRESALELPKACGAKVDASLCAKIPSASPTSPNVSPSQGDASIPAVNYIGLGFLTAFVAIILF